MTKVIRTEKGPEVKSVIYVDAQGRVHFERKDSAWMKLMKKIITA